MKLNEIADTHTEIKAALLDVGILNYSINADGTVDVAGDVHLSFYNFTKLPVKFGKVTGFFECSSCKKLTSLEGAPTHVGGYFDISYCPLLTSLEHCPSYIGKSVTFKGCFSITSLEGFMPQIKDGRVIAEWEHIKSGGISLVMTGTDELYKPTGAFKIIEHYLERPEDIFECQTELIEAGFVEYAKL